MLRVALSYLGATFAERKFSIMKGESCVMGFSSND